PTHPGRSLSGRLAAYPRGGGGLPGRSLCIATARAFGATVEDALRTAVALELLHNAFLVHDDVEDESEARRGRPTMNALHGPAVAGNVGGALTMLALPATIHHRPRPGSAPPPSRLPGTQAGGPRAAPGPRPHPGPPHPH